MEYQWQNPITLKQTVLGQGWIVKQLSKDKDVAASSFITDDIVVNLSIVRASNQTLTDLVNHLKTSDATLRFVNQGFFGRTGNLPNWTGIATSRDDHTKKYVVHVTSAATGYGILIGALAQQTAGSVSRLETLMAELDLTFKDN
ncbi:hypothetical protein ACL2XP_07440 [Sodalis sp. RH21]|uniref:hypothetical protein n=1 Tax=unclassified Sodalis (in: enterobacteria) TaxID=2636512 RepID=UPI0039B5E6D7